MEFKIQLYTIFDSDLQFFWNYLSYISHIVLGYCCKNRVLYPVYIPYILCEAGVITVQ